MSRSSSGLLSRPDMGLSLSRPSHTKTAFFRDCRHMPWIFYATIVWVPFRAGWTATFSKESVRSIQRFIPAEMLIERSYEAGGAYNRPKCQPTGNETGFRSLYLLSRARRHGIGDRAFQSCTPLLVGKRVACGAGRGECAGSCDSKMSQWDTYECRD